MKISLLSLVFLTAFIKTSIAQKPYFTNGSNFIFTYGLVTDTSNKFIKSNVRFSAWYNFEEILNIDFSKSAGLITGLGLQNIGIITRPTESITIKQRTYCLTLPLGFRFGNLEKKNFLSIGASAELMIDYKEKVFNGNKKIKHHEFLSNNTDLLNASVFLRYQKKSIYVSAKYYLYDFLRPSNVQVSDNGFFPLYPNSSQLLFLSIGYSRKGNESKINTDKPLQKKVNRI